MQSAETAAVPVPAELPRGARRFALELLRSAKGLTGLALMLIGIEWGLPNVHSWNGDDIAPEKPLRVVHDWLFGHHKYPYFHWWLNLPLYAPWLSVVALRGELDLGCFPRIRTECFANPWRDMTVFIACAIATAMSCCWHPTT